MWTAELVHTDDYERVSGVVGCYGDEQTALRMALTTEFIRNFMMMNELTDADGPMMIEEDGVGVGTPPPIVDEDDIYWRRPDMSKKETEAEDRYIQLRLKLESILLIDVDFLAGWHAAREKYLYKAGYRYSVFEGEKQPCPLTEREQAVVELLLRKKQGE